MFYFVWKLGVTVLEFSARLAKIALVELLQLELMRSLYRYCRDNNIHRSVVKYILDTCNCRKLGAVFAVNRLIGDLFKQVAVRYFNSHV